MTISVGLTSGQAILDGLPVAPPVAPAPPGAGLAPSENLFTVSQSTFATDDHIDFRGNWALTDGRLTCLRVDSSDARLSFDAPLVAGRAYYAHYDLELQGGTLKLGLGGGGTAFQARAVNDAWQCF